MNTTSAATSATTVQDTLGIRMYGLEIDNTIAVTAHFIQEVVPDTSERSLSRAAFDVEGDTLCAMAQVMLASSYGNLLAISDSVTNGVPYLDITFEMHEFEDQEPEMVHARLFYWKRRFITFCVTAAYRDATAAALLAEGLRNSMQITSP